KKGEITEARVNASVERILRAKAALSLHQKKTVDLNDVDRVVNNPRFNEIAQQIADHSITLVRDQQKLLPLNFADRPQQIALSGQNNAPERKGRILNLTFTDEDDRTVTRTFVDELRQRVGLVENYVLDPKAPEAEIDRVLSRVGTVGFDVVIYSLAVRARSGKGSVALPAAGKRIADWLIASRTPLVVISFGNPYLLMAIPDSPSYLLAYSPFPVSQRAAAKAVLGEIEINGKLPVSLPGLYPREHGIKIEKKR
ncbi:MAG: glycoside hydrolase family 3 C-terminal domain-containing protein, partial [Blastocatellia bacterium]